MEHLLLQHVETQAAWLALAGTEECSKISSLWEGAAARWQKHSPWRKMDGVQ